MNHTALGFIDVDLVTIVMAYLLVSHGQTGACIFAFGQGLLMDVFSAGLLGLFTLIYVAVFLGVSMGSRFFLLHSSRGLMILVTLAVLLKEILFAGLLAAFAFEISDASHTFAPRATSALCTGLTAPVVFYVLNRIKRLLTGGREEAAQGL